jgi:hypothetical protein
MRGAGAIALLFGLMTSAASVSGQATEASRASNAQSDPREVFFAGAKEAAKRYEDRREAIADGFRRLGPDFPGMGEHWVQIGRIVSGKLTGDKPSVLCYVQLDSAPRLVGLAYTLPLRADESPPAEPFGEEAWHDHSGEVTEESLLLNHPSSAAGTTSDVRLSMVHVWIPLENPDGVLQQNNWKLPYLRAGLAPPDSPSLTASRGLSLGSHGADYYQELLYWGVGPDEDDRRAVDRILLRYSAQVDRWIERAIADEREVDAHALERTWTSFWRDLEAEVSTEGYARLLPLKSGHEE